MPKERMTPTFVIAWCSNIVEVVVDTRTSKTSGLIADWETFGIAPTLRQREI